MEAIDNMTRYYVNRDVDIFKEAISGKLPQNSKLNSSFHNLIFKSANLYSLIIINHYNLIQWRNVSCWRSPVEKSLSLRHSFNYNYNRLIIIN